jgi:hypothetical protein
MNEVTDVLRNIPK